MSSDGKEVLVVVMLSCLAIAMVAFLWPSGRDVKSICYQGEVWTMSHSKTGWHRHKRVILDNKPIQCKEQHS